MSDARVKVIEDDLNTANWVTFSHYAVCPICAAMVSDDEDKETHLQWHLSLNGMSEVTD